MPSELARKARAGAGGKALNPVLDDKSFDVWDAIDAPLLYPGVRFARDVQGGLGIGQRSI